MLKARIVLNDAKNALEQLDECVNEDDIRILWFASMGLMRTSFDVLDKVDGKISREIRAAIDKQWEKIKSSRRDNKIFWEFIKKERDLLIHRYEVTPEYEVAPLVVFVDDKPTWEGDEFQEFFHLTTGAYAFQDARDITWEAYEWLDQKIGEIEKVA